MSSPQAAGPPCVAAARGSDRFSVPTLSPISPDRKQPRTPDTDAREIARLPRRSDEACFATGVCPPASRHREVSCLGLYQSTRTAAKFLGALRRAARIAPNMRFFSESSRVKTVEHHER
jgi:hypothetical protein